MRRDFAQSNQRSQRGVGNLCLDRSLWDSFHSGVVALFWFGIVHSDPLPQLPVEFSVGFMMQFCLGFLSLLIELRTSLYEMLHDLFATRTI